MKFYLDKNAGRFGRGGLWSYSLMFLWFAAAAIVHFINHRLEQDIVLCPFKHFTGYPCATCGMTRAAVELLKANFTEAFVINPLASILMIAFVIWSGFRLLTGTQINLRLGKRSRIVIVISFIISLAVNWWYVITQTTN